MIEVTESDIGRRVIYKENNHGKCERGVITSFNDRYVFVRYDDQMPDSYGKATKRKNLSFDDFQVTINKGMD